MLKYSFNIYLGDSQHKNMFQFNSASLCLTYSNVDQQQHQLLSDSSSVAKLLSTIHHGDGIQYMVVAQESHKDGSRHFHAAIKFTKSFRTRNERFWDLGSIHPNIQPARHFLHWVKYVKKDGNYVEQGFLPQNKPTMQEIVEMAKSMDKLEYLAWMSFNKFNYATTIWEMAHPDLTHTITAEMVLNTLDRVDPILIKTFVEHRWDQSKVLILWGDTGLGKTSMAKIMVPKPALMVSHLDDLKKFRSGYHLGIIFDDVSIKHLPETAQIHLLDSFDTRSIHVRYGTVTIPKDTKKIITCNDFPVSDIPAIQRRIQHFKVTKFIYGSLK